MWTDEHRRAADHRGLRYPSDLTDSEWVLIAPLIPPAKHGGRKRSIDVREVLNGIFYVLSTGCQWNALPKDLPPKSTVYDYFDLWEWDGTLERIHHELYVAMREPEGREASPFVNPMRGTKRDTTSPCSWPAKNTKGSRLATTSVVSTRRFQTVFLPLLEKPLFFNFLAHLLFLQQALAIVIEPSLLVAILFGFALFEAASFRTLIAYRAHHATDQRAAENRTYPPLAVSEHRPRPATDYGTADLPANLVACLGLRRSFRTPRNEIAGEQDTDDQPAE